MTTRGRSAASRVFATMLAAVVGVALLTSAALLLQSQQSARAEAERVTQAVAQTLAHAPSVGAALAGGDRAAATVALQPLATEVMADARVDFVTIMDATGIRVTHRDPAQIGARYLGTIPETPAVLTEQFTGTLGPSLRTIVPVESAGRLVGWVSVGVTVDTVAATLAPRLLAALGIGAALVAAGLVGAMIARRMTRRVAGDLPAGAIRDTLASAESMRTLGEALRAQTHEHANRLHTAIALLELDRQVEAIALLTESSRQSQGLIDRVAARSDGDDTVGALLLGKASQAAERGVALDIDLAPDAPRSLLNPIDQVALVGNLVDNAVDAAAAAPSPRWVRITMSRTGDDELLLVVSDSGGGIAPDVRERVFERGFSTKPAGAAGRGVGLALARAVVDDVGGALTLDEGAPTTFRVILPTAAS